METFHVVFVRVNAVTGGYEDIDFDDYFLILFTQVVDDCFHIWMGKVYRWGELSKSGW